MTDKEKRIYVLNMKDGTKQKITIPATWRLTFGPLVPGSKDGNLNGAGALVLRIYEGSKENQRAVFTGVESWRDTQDLAIEVEQVQTKAQAAYVDIPGEGKKEVVANMEVRQWVDPDKPTTARVEFGNVSEGLPQLSSR